MADIKNILGSLAPVSLSEMDNVRLMDRVDIKYVLSAGRLSDLLIRLNGNYKVLEIDGNRIFSYFTRYLDTSGYYFFNQHVRGKPERHKVRFRTYESTGTTYLEVKKRTNRNRTIKCRIKNDLTSDNRCDEKASVFLKEYIPGDALQLHPVLVNSFKRITLVGSAFNERATIDFDLSFSDNAGKVAGYPHAAIIEIKKPGRFSRSPMADILKELSVHPTGFSKYCFGTSVLYDIPRKNIMREKIILINRIENEYYRSNGS
jgi:hypothetical protein